MKLYLTNAAGTVDITQLYKQCIWSGDKSSIARKVAAGIVYDEKSDWPVPALGNGITLTHNGRTLFSGYVIQRTLDSESAILDITCYDKGIYLRNNSGTYKFRAVPPEFMASTVCSDRGIPVMELAKADVQLNRKFSGVKLDKIITTAYSLAAEQTGERYAIRMMPEGLQVKVRTQSRVSVNLLPKSNLMVATTTESIYNMVNQVGIYDEQGNRLGTVSDTDAAALYGVMEEHIVQRDGENAQAEAQALLEDGALTPNISVQCLGDPSLITGETVVAEEPSTGLSGLFWIDADTHTWSRGIYTCKLTLNCRNVMTKSTSGSELD